MNGIVKAEAAPGAVYRTDLPLPEIEENQVLVKVHAAAICGTDMHIYDWTQYAQERLRLPMVFGHEFAGEIVKLGRLAEGWQIGDRVAGETHIPCNACEPCRTGRQHICENMKIIGVQEPGAFADYIPVHKDCLWRLSEDVDWQTGAVLEPMGVAVHGVLSGEIGGKTVVILGCGPIGLFAVAAAKASGAAKVIAVDLFPQKLAVAKRIGADAVVNSREEDVAQVVARALGGGADVVIDYTGNRFAIAAGFAALKKGGRFTFVGLSNDRIPLDVNNDIIYKEAQVNGVTGRLMYKTWYDCERLLKTGRIDVQSILGGRYRMSDFDSAFAAIKAGAPGKMLLIPDDEF